VSMNKHVTPIS